MKSYALGLAVDGFEDDKISCFHEGKKTSREKKVRKSNEVVIYLRTRSKTRPLRTQKLSCLAEIEFFE